MRRVLFLCLAGAGLAIWSLGCGGGQSASESGGGSGGGATPAASSGDHQGHEEHGDHGAEGGSGSESSEGLAALPPEDRALAEKQGVCPVSGEELGSMGTPVKVEHEGKVVFLCCDHCKKKFDENPAEYVAKATGGESGE